MPTDRELREISKKAMAKNREEKAKIKELKEKGLCVYEGEVIPVMEARKCGGQKGVKFGVQGAKFGVEGAKFGAQGAKFGAQGAKFAAEGAKFGAMGAKFGAQGAEFGAQGAKFGAQGAKFGVEGAKFGALGGHTWGLAWENDGFYGWGIWSFGERGWY